MQHAQPAAEAFAAVVTLTATVLAASVHMCVDQPCWLWLLLDADQALNLAALVC
jgi:hypothetical protein